MTPIDAFFIGLIAGFIISLLVIGLGRGGENYHQP